MIKKIHVTLDPFTVENGCLTPTLKIRRYVSRPVLRYHRSDSSVSLPQEGRIQQVQR